MKLVAIVLAFAGSSAFASTNGYYLKMDLSLNGKHISSPKLAVKVGEPATISQKIDTEESFIEVVVTEGSIQNRKGILMSFVVGVVDQSGQRVIKSKPQVLSKENESAQITVGESNGDEVSLSVVANRRSL
ncbi:hypothetical protein [Bdellovibrio bacteriovorus]|uniref:hypothetical protein n=1 Tax=Bdellovibrio bacteriovorus TaxID=959 RepID=UPI0002D8146F|nr:hypothetical protein [Bdellovibrio bacteriovorus]